MTINTLYDIGDTVYATTDKEQLPRMITDVKVHPNNLHNYGCMCGTIYSSHYEIELEREE